MAQWSVPGVVAQQSSISMSGAIAVMAGIAVVLVGSGVIVRWSARSGAIGTLGRNGYAGLRTKATMASDEAWLAAQQAAERDTVNAGVAMAVSGVLSMVAAVVFGGGNPDRSMIIWSIGLVIGFVALAAFMTRSVIEGQRAAKEHPPNP